MTDLDLIWTSSERRTLRFATLWVLSAITGRARFDEDERDAYWDAVTSAALRSQSLGRAVLEDAATRRRWVFEEFREEERPVVSGLLEVLGLLERVSPDARDDVRRAVLHVGREFALARGPFGRRMSLQDEQSMALVEQLLQTPRETVDDNPLNSALPI